MKKGIIFRLMIIFIILLILGIVGFIAYNFIDNKKAEKNAVELPKLSTVTLGNIKFSVTDNFYYDVEDDTLFITDSKISDFVGAVKVSGINATTIKNAQESFKENLNNAGYIVSESFNYSVNDYEFVGYLVTIGNEENLLTFVNADANNTLVARTVINDKSNIGYENVCEALSIILLNSEVKNSQVSNNTGEFPLSLPGLNENNEDIIPFAFE